MVRNDLGRHPRLSSQKKKNAKIPEVAKVYNYPFPKLTWLFQIRNTVLFYESMMASLPIISFVTIDIYEKVKIHTTIEMYSNDEKTDANGITIKNASAVALLGRQ
jgi:hypothetical protein